MRFRQVLVLTFLVSLASACVSAGALHSNLHPSLQGNTDAAGIGIGVLDATAVDGSGNNSQSLVGAPYGEGWIRFSTGSDQVELRVTPSLGYVGYRYNVTSAADGGLGVALKPSLGLGIVQFDVQHPETTTMTAPNLSLLLSFAGGSGYAALRGGGLVMMTSDHFEEFTSVGGQVGFISASEPFDYSFEVGVQYIMPEHPGAIYVITPSIGIQL